MNGRRLAAAGAVVAVALLLSGCVPEYFAKINAGQQRVDTEVEEAGLEASVDADYSCTGALPFTATTCRAAVTVTTDDLDVIERAAELEALRAETDGRSWTVVYRGTTYWAEPDNLAQLPVVDGTLPTGVTIDRVEIGDARVGIALTDVTSFEQLCALGEEQTSAGIITSRVEGRTDLEVRLDAVDDAAFADACDLGDAAIDSLGLSTLTRVGIGPDDAGGLTLTIIPKTQDALDAAREWVAAVAIPEGVDVDASVYY
ncbi:hypothetical protein BJ978_002202 [Agromyces terreus]|uniref:Uncharacterized protein n=1 Tax=Agromyces terreus TaxID=424795 RepID=A0A9X2H1N3_9MICO|nr:hypothetical protein [Agromyces terreus]MCP2371526.1 hypothetical protein [Agromyces terreus]